MDVPVIGLLRYASKIIRCAFWPKEKDDSPLHQFMMKIICQFQGHLAQAVVLSDTKHSDMERVFRSIKSDNGDKKATLEKKKKDLDNYLEETIREAFNAAAHYLEKYFAGRAKGEGPRMCLKFVERSDGQEYVVDGYRRPSAKPAYSMRDPLKVNSGFSSVRESGRSFLENDIPEAVVRKDGDKDKYYNRRIHEDAVGRYLQGLGKSPFWRMVDQIRGREQPPDVKWHACWDEGGRQIEPRSCYKSTMIVPLTFWNNELHKEFLEGFHFPAGDQRSILAFFCLDHQESGFFVKKLDQPMVYVFADLISLFLVIHMNYVENSPTYKDVAEYLANPQV